MIRKFYEHGELYTGGESFSIAEYNKRCAEFLGYKKDTVDGWDVVRIPDKTWSEWSNRFQDYIENDWYALYEPSIHSLEFNSDWNWIMEVVEAIEKLGFYFISYNETVKITDSLKDVLNIEVSVFIKDIDGVSKKEAVVKAIDRFLIWYNGNK